ncbi:hypothetical protein MMC24_007248 [Lignoscripta atroalba]|nr:hypothetical protein [Lignoscripta atroalba]
MASTPIPRFLVLQRDALLRRTPRIGHQLKSLRLGQQHTHRHASTKAASPKPRVLEKPSKFAPPSHPARLNRAPRQYPGPPLSGPEVEAQKTKQYPHMMPPEGSFMRWFLTNRSIHMWITLSTLLSLAIFTFFTNFHRTSAFTHLLPPGNTFFSHPINFISQYIEVYKLHTAYISAKTAERRRKKVEDVQKRSQYRKAHGLDKQQGLGGWTAKEEHEAMGPALKLDGAVGNEMGGKIAQDASLAQDPTVNVDGRKQEAAAYVDWQGRRRPVRKWLGIW